MNGWRLPASAFTNGKRKQANIELSRPHKNIADSFTFCPAIRSFESGALEQEKSKTCRAVVY